MKLILRGTLWLGLIATVLSGCAPSHYTAEDLARLEAKEVRGVVTAQSRGSFVLRDGGGEEKTYRTGQLTEYIPQDYRSQEGDEVRVAFQEVWERSGKAKLAVLQLEALQVPERNRQLPNPIEGEIVAVDRGSASYVKSVLIRLPGREDALPIYVDPVASIETDGEAHSAGGFNFNRIVGKSAQVTADREPILRGNAYIYVTKRIVVR